MPFSTHLPILKKDWKIINEELLFAESIKGKLKRWLDLLSQDGKNTKLQVKNEIKAVLEDLGNAKKEQ